MTLRTQRKPLVAQCETVKQRRQERQGFFSRAFIEIVKRNRMPLSRVPPYVAYVHTSFFSFCKLRYTFFPHLLKV
jgi:hypothetical protein